MKTIHLYLVGMTIVSFTFYSCAVNHSIVHTHAVEFKSGKELSGVFVKKIDGQVIYFNTLELVNGAFTAPHLLADGRLKIKADEILAYQTSTHYAISQVLMVNARKSYISKEALPGFAVRLVKGKLNVYCKQFFNGRAAVNEFYIQSGNDGEIKKYTADLMKKMIGENEEALSYLNDKNDKVSMLAKIQSAAAAYNNFNAVTQN